MLYITYDNTKNTDGAGAQLLRIVSAYLIAKYYNIGYIHSPLLYITNYGLLCLENKKTDITQIEKYNNLINFISDTNNYINQIVEIKDINSNTIDYYKDKAQYTDILLKISYPIFSINYNPDILNLSNIIDFSWCSSSINISNIKIGIHIRRGDILFIEKEIRYLDNQYYISLMKQIDIILSDIPHEFHIYTENPTKKINITEEFRDDLKGINTIIEPDSYDEFSEFNNINWHINTDPIDTFIELCNSDMLITSISAYSYLASILNKKAIIIHNKKMVHPPKKNWILIEQNIISNNDIDYIKNYYNTKINKPIKYISGGALGDFIHQLSVIKEKYIQTGRKGILYISHTARDTDKFPFGLEKAYNDTYKLIINQEYIESYHIHNNEPYDINLSSWVVNQPLFKNNWHHIFSSEYTVNWCSNKYLNIEYNNKYKDYILFSSSIKRFNSSIDYNKLFEKLPYMPIFVTTIKSEYENFKYKTGINNIECIYYDNLYDLYVAINSCKLFIGNLSSPLTIAQAVYKSRICILQSNINNGDNIHMKNLDNIWDNCLYIYNSDDLYKISKFCNKLFKL